MYGQGSGQGGGQAPPGWPPTLETGRALLDPPSMMQRAKNGVYYARQPVFEPRPWLAVDPGVGSQPRRYVTGITGEPANTEVISTIQIDIPGCIYALTGAAYDTVGNTSAGLDQFLVRFEHSTGDRLDTIEALGSALLGTAQFPALIGGVGWNFDRGSTIRVGITPLVANLRIDVVCWMIEQRGPMNWGSLG